MSEDATREVRVEEVSVDVSRKPSGSWRPVLLMIIVMPVLSYLVTDFILIPKIKNAVEGRGEASGTGKAGQVVTTGADGDTPREVLLEKSYDFPDVVVNLSGANGTRYLKASFKILSSAPDLEERIGRQKNELQDMVINILSSRSIADIGAPGAMNLLRNELMQNFNRVLKGNVVEQIYFYEFVSQ